MVSLSIKKNKLPTDKTKFNMLWSNGYFEEGVTKKVISQMKNGKTAYNDWLNKYKEELKKG